MNNDSILIKDFIENSNTNAINELLGNYQQFIFSTCIKYTDSNDDAKDYLQEVMIKVYEKIHSYSSQAKFSTWLYSITRNYCFDQTKKNKHTKKIYTELISSFSKEEIVFDFFEEENDRISLKYILNLLPVKDRELLKYKYLKNKTIKEISIETGLSESCIKMRLSRSMVKARKAHSIRPLTD